MKKLAVLGIAAMGLFACGQSKTEAALSAQKAEMEAQQLRDSIDMVKKIEQEEVVKAEAAAEAKRSVQNNYYSSGSKSSGTTSSSSSTSGTAEKKGWSNKAKGAVIGAGVGAITGAAVSKDQKGKGALIGAGVGAAAGLGTGAILDNKKKKEAEGN